LYENAKERDEYIQSQGIFILGMPDTASRGSLSEGSLAKGKG